MTTHDEAILRLDGYARRWTIETFKTLKSGCRIEPVRLTTADRLADRIALCRVVAWRIHWTVMLRRNDPNAPPRAAFTDVEIEDLDDAPSGPAPDVVRDLESYVIRVARLGGHLAGRHDPPPGSTVAWRGFSRLADLVEGHAAGRRVVGH